MPDRKKVVKGLECHAEKCEIRPGELCPYFACGTECVRSLCNDALESLKEQEPIEPKQQEETGRQKYCANCGRKVKWDG